MVYLVGVDHLVQYSGPAPERLRGDFRRYLVDSARGLGIALIAEEFSLEALTGVYHAEGDTALEAARTLGIPHRFCDPEEPDMRKLGIPYFAELVDRVRARRGIRERFILDRDLRESVRREAAGLARTYWPAREAFWYGRIAPDIGSNILFICGHEHVGSFQALVRERGNGCEVLDPFWRKDIFSDYANIGLE